MTEPGWYHAQGDPPGTQRYWDGTQWLGDAVYEPPVAPTNYGYGQPAAPADVFPGSLKVLAIVVSIVKAIPLAIALFVAVVLGAIANDIDDTFNSQDQVFDDLVGAAVAIVIVMVLAAGALLVFQLVGAIKERPMMVFIPAVLMALFDVVVVFSSWLAVGNSNGSAGWAFTMTIVAAAQIAIAVQAIRANKPDSVMA